MRLEPARYPNHRGEVGRTDISEHGYQESLDIGSGEQARPPHISEEVECQGNGEFSAGTAVCRSELFRGECSFRLPDRGGFLRPGTAHVRKGPAEEGFGLPYYQLGQTGQWGAWIWKYEKNVSARK